MIKEVSVTIDPKDEKNDDIISALLKKELKKCGIDFSEKEMTSVFVKKSIDARHRQVKLHLRYKVYIGEKPDFSQEAVPEWKKADGKQSVVIVGAGPAGLFAALKLLEYGIKPVIIERGSETSKRKKDIARISTQHKVDENSNYCFGEGGAGTFSDGKLYTRSNKRGDVGSILRIFAHFGADKSILTDAHPHIGTDRLPQVVNNIRNTILHCGGEIWFDHKCTGFVIEDGTAKGVVAQNLITLQERTFMANAVILATGHSAPDIYRLIARTAPDALEAKTFAAGVRVEHPRALIDRIQFHGAGGSGKELSRDSTGKPLSATSQHFSEAAAQRQHGSGDTLSKKTSSEPGALGAAEYRLVTQADGRGVYSFCMCPGGFVVPSASAPDEIVVNGMSSAKRNSRWSNAAIVVEIRPEDIPAEFQTLAQKDGCPALAGLYFRSHLEHLSQEHGEAQKAPAQRLTDFLARRTSGSLPQTSYTPGIVSSDLNAWLPPFICDRLQKAFPEFNRKMRGYVCPEAVMIAIETRTSTPVRICRDADTLECTHIQNLYPAGEGSGYAGGIVSSAMDGENCCKKIVQKFKESGIL